MLDMPLRVARNGGAGRVRSNAEGSKSASTPDRSGKFKNLKQRVAPDKYVRPKEWKIVRRYKTCYGARLDDEDMKFDMYQKAHTLMELSGHRMLPEQDEAPNGLHLWTFKRQANAASNRFLFYHLRILMSSSLHLQLPCWFVHCGWHRICSARTSLTASHQQPCRAYDGRWQLGTR